MSTTPTMDDLATNDYEKLEERLVDDYGAAAKAVVHQAVEQERSRFSDARVHAFVPVLVERSVRTRLGKPGHA